MQPAIIAIGVGVVGALAYRYLTAKTAWQGGIQVWKQNQVPALKSLLEHAHVQSIGERTWRVLPGATGGDGNALETYKAIRLRGNIVSTTTNLLDSGDAPRGMAEITVDEFVKMTATPKEIAILPNLLGSM